MDRALFTSEPARSLGLEMSFGPSNDDAQGFDMEKFMEDYVVETRPSPFSPGDYEDFGGSISALNVNGAFGGE